MSKYIEMIDGKIGLNGTPLKTSKIISKLNRIKVLENQIKHIKNCCRELLEGTK